MKTVKYFKSIEHVQNEVERAHAALLKKGTAVGEEQIGSME